MEKFSFFANFNRQSPTLHTKLAKKENFSVFANFNRQSTNFTHEIGEEGEFLRLRQFQPSTHQLYTRNWRRRRISPSSPISTVNPQLYTRNWRRRRISPSSPNSTVNPPTLHTKLAKKENFSVFANFNRQSTNFTHEIGLAKKENFAVFANLKPKFCQLQKRDW